MDSILITGAGGFIGSHLVERSLELGLRVRAFVRYNSSNHWGWLDESPFRKDIEVITGDIRDYDSVFKAMRGCRSVFHLAALIGIPYSYKSPLAYLRTNVEGTYNVLEASLALEFESVIVTSTSEVYGSAQIVPIDEGHRLHAQSPYSASKIAADQIALSYHRSFNLPVKIVRPFNAFGPRQSARAIIPTVITQILSGRNDILLGNTNPTRDLTFVKDTVEGFVEIFRCPTLVGEVTNIGMNEEISMADLVERIGGMMGQPVTIKTDKDRVRPQVSEVTRLRADNSKIKNNTSWAPRYDLKKGLEETIAWYREHRRKFKPDLYNV